MLVVERGVESVVRRRHDVVLGVCSERTAFVGILRRRGEAAAAVVGDVEVEVEKRVRRRGSRSVRGNIVARVRDMRVPSICSARYTLLRVRIYGKAIGALSIGWMS